LGGLNVEAFGSGALGNEFVDRLFRQAKCVVFPSLYEGFGLPLVQGLAYGKAVVARRSRVFHEVVSRFPKSGSLVEFENSLDLVYAIGKVLHGKEGYLARDVTGASMGTAAHGWKACAEQFFAFAEQMRKLENVEVGRARDRALRYVKSGRQ
jgi:glycosyltransferase involved in cell wall biosynthesis